MMTDTLVNIIEPLSAVIALLGVVVSIVAAIRDGVLKRLVIGPFTLESSSDDVKEAKALIEAVRSRPGEETPFETKQLARHYAQVLAQSKTSFWSSLVFAFLGFMVIIAAALI